MHNELDSTFSVEDALEIYARLMFHEFLLEMLHFNISDKSLTRMLS